MVKSYQRFEQAATFGTITSNSNCIWIPPASTEKSTNPGKLITAALENVNVWNVKTGELDTVLSDVLPPGASDAKTTKPAEVTYLCYHQETNILAVGYNDGVIKIWDLLAKIVLLNFNGHKSAITKLLFDSTGTKLFSGSRDSDIIAWDLVGEVGLYKLRSHKDSITGMWLDPEHDENWLISTSKDGLIKIWDLKIQQCVETHVAHTGECWALSVYANIVITSSADTQIKIWELNLDNETEGAETGSRLVERGVYDKQSKQRGVDIEFARSSNGNTFFYVQNADRTLEVFRLRKQEEIAKATKKRQKRLQEKGMSEEEIEANIKASFISMFMQPFQTVRATYKIKAATWTYTTNSKLDILLTTANNSIEYYSIPYEKRDPTKPSPDKLYTIDLQGCRTDIRAIDISDDDKLLATASNGSLKVWNLKTTNCIRTFECGFPLVCKFLPGGLLVVIGTKQGELQLFDLASSTLLETVENAHDGAIWSLDITNDGKRLITGSADKTVKFWDFELENLPVPGSSGKVIPTLRLHHNTTLEINDDVLSVKLSPDNKFLAVSLLDNTVKIFFLDTMKFFLSLYGHKLPVLSIDISYDSKLIITSSADKNIKIWGLDFGDCHKSIFAHDDSIMSVRFLPESHNFFSCSKDGLVKYWDGDKFQCIQKLAAHQSEVWALAIAGDASFVVSSSHDRSIRVWKETDDQVFLEEEREKELEEQYEETLLTGLEEGTGDTMHKRAVGADEGEADIDEVTGVHKQTMESLRASERLMEALDLGITEIETFEQYEKELKNWQKRQGGGSGGVQPAKPQSNNILMALNKKPEEYILDTLVKVKPSQLEDALLVFPFSYVLKLLKFIDVVLGDSSLVQDHLALLCKVLFFVVKANYRELVSQRNEGLKLQISSVKDRLRSRLRANVDDIGFNIQGLKFIKQQWNLRHNFEFVDEYENTKQQERLAKKRVYETLV